MELYPETAAYQSYLTKGDKMEGDKFWVIIWGIIATAITTILCSLMVVNHFNERLYVENGYTRETLPGCQYTQWVKK